MGRVDLLQELAHDVHGDEQVTAALLVDEPPVLLPELVALCFSHLDCFLPEGAAILLQVLVDVQSLVVLHLEDGLDGQQHCNDDYELLEAELSAQKQHLGQLGSQGDEGDHLAQLGHPAVVDYLDFCCLLAVLLLLHLLCFLLDVVYGDLAL